MAHKVTPELIRRAYELLCETLPFSKWNLPDSDDLHFKVSRNRKEYGAIEVAGPTIWICVSDRTVGHLQTLLATVAHELIHLHQIRSGLDLDHGPAFQKWADLVCRHHRDFDPKNFG